MNRRLERGRALESQIEYAVNEEIKWKDRLRRSNYMDNYAATKLQEVEAIRVCLQEQLQENWSFTSRDDIYRIWQHLKKRNPDLTVLDALHIVGKHLEQSKGKRLP